LNDSELPDRIINPESYNQDLIDPTTEEYDHQTHAGMHVHTLASYPGSLGEGEKRAWYLLFAHALN